jgi:hypothetical protein
MFFRNTLVADFIGVSAAEMIDAVLPDGMMMGGPAKMMQENWV